MVNEMHVHSHLRRFHPGAHRFGGGGPILQAAPVFQSSSSYSDVLSAGVYVVPAPSGVSNGDLVVVMLSLTATTDLVTPPSGFQEIANTMYGATSGSGPRKWAAFWKIAGSSEPATYDFTHTSTDTCLAVAVRYSGVDSKSPVANMANQMNVTTLSHSMPGTVIDAVNASVLHCLIMMDDRLADIVTPSGVTYVNGRDIDQNNNRDRTIWVGRDTSDIESLGATPLRTATLASGNESSGGFSFAILPPLGGGSAPVVQSETTGNHASSSAITVNKPSGTVAGDLLVCTIASAQPWSEASGWSVARREASWYLANSVAVFYKVAGGSEPSSYSFPATSSSGLASHRCYRISGASASAPINATAFASDTTAVSSHVVPEITTTRGSCLVLLTGHTIDNDRDVRGLPEMEYKGLFRMGTTSTKHDWVSRQVFGSAVTIREKAILSVSGSTRLAASTRSARLLVAISPP